MNIPPRDSNLRNDIAFPIIDLLVTTCVMVCMCSLLHQRFKFKENLSILGMENLQNYKYRHSHKLAFVTDVK